MMSRLHLASLVALIAIAGGPVFGAAPGSVSGVVRDSAGVPQIGAVVQLLRPDLSVISVVYTSSKGAYAFPNIVPGRYSVKAMGTLFLPSLREGVRVRSNAVVNLTLNTLYEVMQWLPAEPRSVKAPQDDWAWTLRSAANRPLLRWLEDGPLVVVSDRSGARPRLKARLMATGQEGTFGESGERFTASVEDTPSESRELLARVDFAPNTDAGMESMLGFRQDLGFAGSVQSVAAVSIHPEIDGANGQGLDEATVRSWETMNMGDELELEAGAQQVLARFSQDSPNIVMATMPFASVAWRGGNSTVSYRMTSAGAPSSTHDESQAGFWLPRLAMQSGELKMERGLHQEIGWERRTDASGMSFVVYSDRIDNPIIEAGGQVPTATNAVLFDRTSGLMRGVGPAFTTAGLVAAVERRLPGGNHLRLSYANGDALVMPAAVHAAGLAQVFNAARPHRAQAYSISLSGTLDGSGTRWRASYRWQPADTVTSVASYAVNAAEPYLNIHMRQPICRHRDGVGVEALLDVRNLLAEGYRPYSLNDGSLLVFSQDQRSIGGGVAFTF
jgi:Carboxypeptidase regulatory-like domain/TonB dependent receptor